MAEELPPVQKQAGRIEITAESLAATAPVPPVSAAFAPAPTTPPAPPRPTSLRAVKQPAVPGTATFCHACGNRVDPRAVMCPACGVPQHAAAMSQTHAMANVALNKKSNGMAILLSLLFVGAGQWYMGRVGRGFAFFGAYVLSWILVVAVIGLFAIPVVAIWAAVDANKLANEHNARLLTEVTGVV